MMRTIWDSRTNLPAAAPPFVISNPGAETGILHQAIDLNTVQNLGDNVAVELETLINGVAPGATKTVTLNVAFCSDDNRTPTELAASAVKTVLTLTNNPNIRQIIAAASVPQLARWCHIWFDHDAIAANSTIALRARVNVKQGGSG